MEECENRDYIYLGLMAVVMYCNKYKKSVEEKECKRCYEDESRTKNKKCKQTIN